MGITDWYPIPPYYVGELKKNYAWAFRTRRPLQVQEMPLEKAPDNLHAWMRLQEEINRIVGGQIQTLRDEIQKLKGAKECSTANRRNR
jgi:hypothetical protein